MTLKACILRYDHDGKNPVPIVHGYPTKVVDTSAIHLTFHDPEGNVEVVLPLVELFGAKWRGT